jgi:FecR protein
MVDSRSLLMTTHGVRILCFSVVLLALSALPALAALAAVSPEVRIVRLSLAQGDVQMDRNSGDGWEQAINNMPLSGGARIYAAENSKAELEFEDGSSIRLVGPAQISLIQLSFSPDGSPVNEIEIGSGLVYVNARLNNHAAFRIKDASGESFAITQPSHLRFKVEEQVASLSVMDGEVEALSDASNPRIHGGESYNYILGQSGSAARVARVPKEGEDGWNQQRDRYNDQYASAGAQYSGSDNPNAYGSADLGYYGSYDTVPGYGEVWQPAGVGPDWDPFGYGAWSYYPSWGWTFVSGYPWGWTPFFFGDWFFIGGRGWCWRPGSWRGPRGGPRGLGGWHPRPLTAGGPAHGWSAPHPPAGSAHGTVAIAGSNLRVGPIAATHATPTHPIMQRGGTPAGASNTRAMAPPARLPTSPTAQPCRLPSPANEEPTRSAARLPEAMAMRCILPRARLRAPTPMAAAPRRAPLVFLPPPSSVRQPQRPSVLLRTSALPRMSAVAAPAVDSTAVAEVPAAVADRTVADSAAADSAAADSAAADSTAVAAIAELSLRAKIQAACSPGRLLHPRRFGVPLSDHRDPCIPHHMLPVARHIPRGRILHQFG